MMKTPFYALAGLALLVAQYIRQHYNGSVIPVSDGNTQ